MKVILIILLIILTIGQISVEIDIDDTLWAERTTDRPVYVHRYSKDEGVIYSYSDDGFRRTMPLLTFLTTFKRIDDK